MYRRKGRPENSSPKVFQKLYNRLLNGSLWLEDWRSTGIKSRATVFRQLRFLKSRGLVKTYRDKHRILYELVPLQTKEGMVTPEGLQWNFLLHPLTREEKRQSNARLREILRSIDREQEIPRNIVELIFELEGYLDKIISLPKCKKVLDILEKNGVDWKSFPAPTLIRFLLYPNLSENLCLRCLKRGTVAYFINHPETGETVCPIEGIVREKDPFEHIRPAEERPSPFPYNYDD